MADVNIGQLAATVWEQVIGDKPTDNIFGSFALFHLLGEKGFKEDSSGGRLFEMTLEYAENPTARSYGEWETLDTTRADTFDAARYEWRNHAVTVSVSFLEALRAAGNSGKIDLIKEKLENAKDSHIADMNRVLFLDGTGNAGKDMDGLTKIISETPTTGTVGGINRATYSFWRNKAASGAQTTSAFDNLRASMRSVYNQCSRGGVKDNPTAGITGRAVFEGYENLLVPFERYNKEGSKARGGNAGFDNAGLQFKDATLQYDEDASPSDSLYFLNPKFLKVVYLKGGWMKMEKEVQPANQMGNIQIAHTHANMGTNCSRRLGVVYDIT